MAYLLAAGLMLSATGAAIGMTMEHRDRLDHSSGPVATHYRGTVAVSHRQIGAVSPAGTASTLRCDWAARMTVDRRATAASGTVMTRQVESEPLVSGTRAGWCATHRAAIARDVAARGAAMKDHLISLAREDHEAIRVELDRIHGERRAG